MHQSWKSLSMVFGAALCAALLTGALLSLPTQMTSGIYAQQVVTAGQAKEKLNASEGMDAAQGLSSAFRNVAEVLKPSVVSISTLTTAKARAEGVDGLPPGLREQLPPWLRDEMLRQFEMPERNMPSRQGMGSGVIARADGYILTNNHVVEGADELQVELSDGRKVEGKIVGTDPATDLAVIKIEATGLKAAVFGDSDSIQVGDWVLAIGSPFGLEQTVTAGIISGKNRVQGIVASGDGFEDFLQTDAAINPGNSGGPLVNIQGELVGINTAIMSRTGASAGIGFAIPVSLAQPVMDSIIETGTVRRGFLGAQVAEINADVVKEFDLKTDSGALIRGVVDGQPAATAGILPGDVVVKIDGRAVSSATQLRNLIASKAPGSNVVMTINRNGSNQDIRVTLQERTEESLAATRNNGADVVMGAKIEALTPAMAQDLGLDENTQGFVVTDIQDGSVAAAIGLTVGDVIEQVNGRALTKVEELKAAISHVKESGGRAVRMVIRRGEGRFLAVIRAQDIAD
ncbi:MAG: Do family serine endopeptidase [Planctomycetaceae bacterium]